MVTEDYVSFETAKLLKEKGFKHWCYKCYGDAVYHKGTPISFDEECDLKSEGLEDEIEYVEGGYLYDFGCDNRKEDAKVWAAPTLWVAMKWLREVHNLIISVKFTIHGWLCDITKIVRDSNGFIVNINHGIGDDSLPYCDEYEKSCETAIKYCLEILI